MKKGNGDKQQSSSLSGAGTQKTNDAWINLRMVREAVPLHCLIVGIVLSLELRENPINEIGKAEPFRTSGGKAERVMRGAAVIGRQLQNWSTIHVRRPSSCPPSL